MQLMGWPHVAAAIIEIVVAFLFWITPAWGAWGVALHLGVSSFILFMDGFISNSLGRNIVVLRANGFRDTAVASIMLFNYLSSQLLIVFMLLSFCYDGEPDGIALLASSSMSVWAQRAFCLAVNLGLTDLTFFLAHRELHQNPRLAPYHVMHHCCLRASNTTNLLFHPLDLALEFSGPVFVLFLMHYFVFQDRAVLFLSVFAVQFWCTLITL